MLAGESALNPIVTFNTNVGVISMELFHREKPVTVANLLAYIESDRYTNTFFHRAPHPDNQAFVVQGGGFVSSPQHSTIPANFSHITQFPAIQNEPGGFSNTLGTVAMAKGADVNSATSEFFLNMGNNSFLDGLNEEGRGAFTVFARVLDMTTVNAIAALATRQLTQELPFNDVPFTSNNQLVVITSITGEGTIHGLRFTDSNRNGQRDNGEAAIANATVYVDANNNGVLDNAEISTTTDSNGKYALRLAPGQYTVRTVPPAGSEVTAPGGDGGRVVQINLGHNIDNVDFGTAPQLVENSAPVLVTIGPRTAVIGQQLQISVSATDLNTGDLLTFQLDSNHSPAGATIEQTSNTTAIVRWTPAASDLPGPATLTVRVSDNATPSVSDSEQVTISLSTASAISGKIYFDVNNSGSQDSVERTLGGVSVTLEGTNASGGAVRIVQKTLADGSYVFNNVPAGAYSVSQTHPIFLVDGQETSAGSGIAAAGNDRFTINRTNSSPAVTANFAERGRQPECISFWDYLASSPQHDILVATSTVNGTEWMSFHGDWQGFVSAEVTLNANLSQAHVVVKNANGQSFTTDVPTNDPLRFEFLGQQANTHLVRIIGSSSIRLVPAAALAAAAASRTAEPSTMAESADSSPGAGAPATTDVTENELVDPVSFKESAAAVFSDAAWTTESEATVADEPTAANHANVEVTAEVAEAIAPATTVATTDLQPEVVDTIFAEDTSPQSTDSASVDRIMADLEAAVAEAGKSSRAKSWDNFWFTEDGGSALLS